MKNYIKYLPLLLLSIFFFLPAKVDAKSLSINFDKNEHFNYFYEMTNNTFFYNNLLSWGSNIDSNLSLLSGVNLPSVLDNSKNYRIYIFYTSDLLDFYDSYNEDFVKNLSHLINTNSYYTIIYDYDTYIYGSQYSYVTFLNNEFNLTYEYDGSYYFYFDENGEYLSCVDSLIANHFGNNGRTFNFSLDLNNAEYYISSLYYSSDNFNVSLNSIPININSFVQDDIRYFIEGADGYNSFWNTIIKWFSSAKDFNASGYSLEYFSNYYYYSENYVLSLNNIINFGDQIQSVLSEKYEYFTLSNISDVGYFLIPIERIDSNCGSSLCWEDLYWSTSSIDSKINIVFYNIEENGISSNSYRYTLSTDKANKFIEIDLERIYNFLVDTYGEELYYSEYSDYLIYIYSESPKFINNIYYPVASYNSLEFTGDLSFLNINNGNRIDLSYNELNDFITDSKLTTDVGLKLEDNDLDFDLKVFTSKVEDFIIGFSDVISSLFIMTDSLFTALPFEVQSVFYFILFSGLVILVWRLLKGGN